MVAEAIRLTANASHHPRPDGSATWPADQTSSAQPGHEHGRAREGGEALGQKRHPDGMRLDERVVELPAAEPATDELHVVVEHDVEDSAREDAVREHEDHLAAGPATQSGEPLSEEQRREHGADPGDGLGEIVASRRAEVAQRPDEVEIGIEPPEPDQPQEEEH